MSKITGSWVKAKLRIINDSREHEHQLQDLTNTIQLGIIFAVYLDSNIRSLYLDSNIRSLYLDSNIRPLYLDSKIVVINHELFSDFDTVREAFTIEESSPCSFNLRNSIPQMLLYIKDPPGRTTRRAGFAQLKDFHQRTNIQHQRIPFEPLLVCRITTSNTRTDGSPTTSILPAIATSTATLRPPTTERRRRGG